MTIKTIDPQNDSYISGNVNVALGGFTFDDEEKCIVSTMIYHDWDDFDNDFGEHCDWCLYYACDTEEEALSLLPVKEDKGKEIPF